MDNVVLVEERDGAGQLEHEAVVGSRVGSPGQDELVEVTAFTELHDEPEVTRLLWRTQHSLTCNRRTPVSQSHNDAMIPNNPSSYKYKEKIHFAKTPKYLNNVND